MQRSSRLLLSCHLACSKRHADLAHPLTTAVCWRPPLTAARPTSHSTRCSLTSQATRPQKSSTVCRLSLSHMHVALGLLLRSSHTTRRCGERREWHTTSVLRLRLCALFVPTPTGDLPATRCDSVLRPLAVPRCIATTDGEPGSPADLGVAVKLMAASRSLALSSTPSRQYLSLKRKLCARWRAGRRRRRQQMRSLGIARSWYGQARITPPHPLTPILQVPFRFHCVRRHTDDPWHLRADSFFHGVRSCNDGVACLRAQLKTAQTQLQADARGEYEPKRTRDRLPWVTFSVHKTPKGRKLKTFLLVTIVQPPLERASGPCEVYFALQLATEPVDVFEKNCPEYMLWWLASQRHEQRRDREIGRSGPRAHAHGQGDVAAPDSAAPPTSAQRVHRLSWLFGDKLNEKTPTYTPRRCQSFELDTDLSLAATVTAVDLRGKVEALVGLVGHVNSAQYDAFVRAVGLAQSASSPLQPGPQKLRSQSFIKSLSSYLCGQVRFKRLVRRDLLLTVTTQLVEERLFVSTRRSPWAQTSHAQSMRSESTRPTHLIFATCACVIRPTSMSICSRTTHLDSSSRSPPCWFPDRLF